MGNHRTARRWSVCPPDIPAHEGSEIGAVHASSAAPASGPDENNGQRGHFLYVVDALHFHLQVGTQ